jgi:RND family efflux transporter MFP subunit
MPLEPAYADARTASAGAAPAGAVHISSEKQQAIGVRIGEVERSEGAQDMRTVGRVAVDDRRVFRINAATPGWIVEAMPNSIGSVVQKDEILATFYAREFLGSQQAYFYALDARDRFLAQKASDAQMQATNSQLQAAIDNLLALGMSATQIEALGLKREKAATVAIRSPATGFIVERNVTTGQRFDSGAELFEIADLRKVWILADVFQYEANFVRPGLDARIELPEQGRSFDARVSEVLPQFDPVTRTLKVRLEVDNTGYTLRPDMFVDVSFPVKLPSAVTVPSDAVVDTGLRKTAFVALGDGYFEPRRVETGWRFGGRVQILSGLMPGERVVVSGNFLIDSETRLRAVTDGIRGEPEHDAICGMDVDRARATAARRVSTYNGATYYFCSDSCKKTFDADPTRHARPGRVAPVSTPAAATPRPPTDRP